MLTPKGKRHYGVFTYRIIYSRRRTISISVSPDTGVTVRAPYNASVKSIGKFVSSRSGWILKHLENYKSHTRLNGRVADGEKVLYRGHEYNVRIVTSAKSSVSIEENFLVISLPAEKLADGAERVLKKWFLQQASEQIPAKVNAIISRFSSYQFDPKIISVRTMKRRWGSCSSKGRITINSELIKIADIFTEYVILHELCHLMEHNHGEAYYKLLTEVFPEWKSVRKDLRKYLS